MSTIIYDEPEVEVFEEEAEEQEVSEKEPAREILSLPKEELIVFWQKNNNPDLNWPLILVCWRTLQKIMTKSPLRNTRTAWMRPAIPTGKE